MPRETKREKIGRYEIRMHPSGGFSIYGNELRNNGRYIEPDEVLKRKCREVIESGAKGFSQSIKTSLSYRGVRACGIRSISEGKKALGIEGPYIQTKRGKVKSGVAVPRDDVRKAIQNTWPAKKLQLWQKGMSVKLRGIKDFRRNHQREYASAHNIHGGLQAVFEEVYPPTNYPGAYNRISKRVYAEKVNVEMLGQWFKERFHAGVPISQSYLRHSKDQEETLRYREVLRLVKSPMFGLVGSSFDEVVMRISGLDKEDVKLCKGSKVHI